MKQLIAISLCLMLSFICTASTSEQVAVSEKQSIETGYQIEPSLEGAFEAFRFDALHSPTMYLEFVPAAPMAHYSGYKAQGKFSIDLFGNPHRFT